MRNAVYNEQADGGAQIRKRLEAILHAEKMTYDPTYSRSDLVEGPTQLDEHLTKAVLPYVGDEVTLLDGEETQATVLATYPNRTVDIQISSGSNAGDQINVPISYVTKAYLSPTKLGEAQSFSMIAPIKPLWSSQVTVMAEDDSDEDSNESLQGESVRQFVGKENDNPIYWPGTLGEEREFEERLANGIEEGVLKRLGKAAGGGAARGAGIGAIHGAAAGAARGAAELTHIRRRLGHTPKRVDSYLHGRMTGHTAKHAVRQAVAGAAAGAAIGAAVQGVKELHGAYKRRKARKKNEEFDGGNIFNAEDGNQAKARDMNYGGANVSGEEEGAETEKSEGMHESGSSSSPSSAAPKKRHSTLGKILKTGAAIGIAASAAHYAKGHKKEIGSVLHKAAVKAGSRPLARRANRMMGESRGDIEAFCSNPNCVYHGETIRSIPPYPEKCPKCGSPTEDREGRPYPFNEGINSGKVAAQLFARSRQEALGNNHQGGL